MHDAGAWTDPNNPKATGAAEIVAPIEAYTTPRYWAHLADGDERTGAGSRFEKLRYFKNWPTMGIAYAAPDMQGGNFWGVINHDNEEGIIRIADNRLTRGLKMWTWGFPSFTNQADLRKEPSEAQPYVELWAGVSDQFFHPAQLPAHGEVSIPETYSPDRRVESERGPATLIQRLAGEGERLHQRARHGPQQIRAEELPVLEGALHHPDQRLTQVLQIVADALERDVAVEGPGQRLLGRLAARQRLRDLDVLGGDFQLEGTLGGPERDLRSVAGDRATEGVGPPLVRG